MRGRMTGSDYQYRPQSNSLSGFKRNSSMRFPLSWKCHTSHSQEFRFFDLLTRILTRIHAWLCHCHMYLVRTTLTRQHTPSLSPRPYQRALQSTLGVLNHHEHRILRHHPPNRPIGKTTFELLKCNFTVQ